MTIKKIVTYQAMLFFVFFLLGCITPFAPKGIEGEGETLVIDGDIVVQGDTKIYISLLRPLGNSSSPVRFITEALVWVEDIDGKGYTGSLVTNERAEPYYYIDTKELTFDQQYKLCVSLPDGKRYESDFLTPLLTPEIDTIDFLVNETKTAVDFFVTTHGETPDKHSSLYYKWRYTEDWEIHSLYNTRIYYHLASNRFLPYETDPSPYYYCWKKSESSSIITEKTDHLEENIVYRKKLHTIDREDDRISYLYFIEVSQMSVSQESYLYWLNLEKNTQEIGGLFPILPNEIYGNIRCVSHPNVKVIGYISAGTITSKSLFVMEEELGIYRYPYRCEYYIPPPNLPWSAIYFMGMRAVGYNANALGDLHFATIFCVECTDREGSKIKPSFWPNDHI